MAYKPLTPEERLAYRALIPGARTAEPQDEHKDDSLLGDTFDAFQYGMGKATAGLAEAGHQLTGAEGLRKLSSAVGGWADSQVEQMNPANRAAFEQPFFEEGEDGGVEFGDGATNPRSWWLQLSSLAGQFVPQIALGGGATSLGVRGASAIVSRAGAKQAIARGASAEAAKKAGLQSAATFLKSGGRASIGTAGQAVAGAAIATGMIANEARDEVLHYISDGDLDGSEAYQETYWELAAANPKESVASLRKMARAAVGDQVAASVARDPALLATNLLLDAVGGHYIDRLLRGVGTGSRLSNAGQQFAAQGATEAVQGGTEQYAINRAMIDERVDPDRDPMEGVLVGAANEGVLGGALGGLAGAARKGRPEERAEQPPNGTEEQPGLPGQGEAGDPGQQTSGQRESVAEEQERPARQRGFSSGSIDDDIMIARRMGFFDEEVQLKAAKRNYELANEMLERGRAAEGSGDHGTAGIYYQSAQRFMDRGNATYQDVIDTSNGSDAFTGNLPTAFDFRNSYEEAAPTGQQNTPVQGETVDGQVVRPALRQQTNGRLESGNPNTPYVMGYGNPEQQAAARAATEQAFTEQQGNQPRTGVEPGPQADPGAVDWVSPGKVRQPKQRQELSLSNGDGIDFRPPPPEAPDTGNIERMIAMRDDADVDARRDAKLPENYKESRLLRDDYRSQLQSMADELVPDGGAMGAPLADGARAASENPEWFRAGLSREEKQKGGGVKGFQQAVKKALAGEALSASNRHAIDAMLNHLANERSRQVGYAKEARNQRRIDRAKYAKLKKFIRGEISPEELGMGEGVTFSVPDTGYDEPDIPFDDIDDQYFTVDGIDDIGKELAQDIHNALKVGAPESVVARVVSDNIDNPVALASELESLTWQYIRGETYAEEGAPASAESTAASGGMEEESTSGETLSTYDQEDLDRLNEQERRPEPELEVEPPESFVLAGSDRPADQAEARGQRSLLDFPSEPEQAEAAPQKEESEDAWVSRSQEAESPVSRDERIGEARRLGFDTSRIWYRGSLFEAGDLTQSSSENFTGSGVYLTNIKGEAEAYASSDPSLNGDFVSAAESLAKAEGVSYQDAKKRLDAGRKTIAEVVVQPGEQLILGRDGLTLSATGGVVPIDRFRQAFIKAGYSSDKLDLLFTQWERIASGEKKIIKNLTGHEGRKAKAFVNLLLSPGHGVKNASVLREIAASLGMKAILLKDGTAPGFSGYGDPGKEQEHLMMLDPADAFVISSGPVGSFSKSEAPNISSEDSEANPPIRNSAGKPFKTRGAAKGQLRKHPGYGIVEVDGGFELRHGVDSTIDTAPRTKPNGANDDLGPDIDDIDAAANEAATSPSNDKPQPTDAQIEAGNYKKGHVTIHGMDVTIENSRGSNRSGTDPDGNQWSVEMKHHYGYIKKTEGADGEHIDVFIGKNPDSKKVFVVDQVNADGSFDEHKVMLGFSDRAKAITGYKSNYQKGWKVGPVTEMSVDEFKQWLDGGDTSRPVADSQEVTTEPRAEGGETMSLLTQFEEMIDAVRDGKATLEQYQSGYRMLIDQKGAVLAEMNAKTKAQLLDAGGPYFAYSHKSDKKAEVIGALYSDMLSEFALGRGYGPNSYMMTSGGYERYKQQKAEALTELVNNTTEEDLKAFADDISQRRQERQKERQKELDALTNPETLSDYRKLLRALTKDDMTINDAYLKLKPEQRARYDELNAESTREAREQRKTAINTKVVAAGDATGGSIQQTKHTKTGEDLFVVVPEERVERDVYNQWNATAKRMGGWYSKFRGRGAIPGFQFKTNENAEAFLKYIGGDTDSAQAQVDARRDAYADDKSQSAVERLTEMAAKLDEKADAQINADRKTNTARRARFAARAIDAAERDKALAETMRGIAKSIEDGSAKFLDAVRTKTQVEALAGYMRVAKGNEIRDKYPSYAEQQKHEGEKATAATVDYADYPTYTSYRSDLASLARKMKEVDGLKKLGDRLLGVADDVTDAYLDFAKKNLAQVSRFSIRRGDGERMATFSNRANAEASIRKSGLTGKAIVLPIKRGENAIILSPSEAMNLKVWEGDNDKRITLNRDFGAELVQAISRKGNKTNQLEVPWQLQNAHDRLNALSRMGIETASEFRSALREFVDLQKTPERNKVREMELAMVGRKNDGLDFFPTPGGIADQMIESAEIAEGMRVLEPSAGMGHIADRIRETGVDPDVVEFSKDRRDLLKEKGFEVVANDFTSLSEGGYDRIVMNPPFSNRRDAEHVQHAYELLKPGGRIVAIMGEGVFFGSDKKAQAFRDWLEAVEGSSEKLPPGSFMDPSLPANTSVSARMVVIDKPIDKAVLTRIKDAVAGITSGNQPGARLEAAASTSSEILIELINNWVEPLESSLNTKVNVVASTTDLPASLESQVSSDTEALFDQSTGDVYLIAENIDTEAKAVRAMLHEVVGHKGVINLLQDAEAKGGSGFHQVLDDIYRDIGRVAIDRKIGRYGFDYKKAGDRRTAVLEYIAHMAETGQRPHLVQRVVAALKAALRRLWPQVGWTETDVLALIERGRQSLSGANSDTLETKGFGSIVRGSSKPAKGMPVEKVQELVDAFQKAYNGNVPLKFKVADTQEELYGPEATIERFGVIEGAYHPARGLFTLAASNLSSHSGGRKTIRHELFGHFGLNTFSGASKKAFLQEVVKTRSEPSMSNTWRFVDRNYPEASELGKAEEVFSYIAESVSPNSGINAIKDRIMAALQRLMRSSGIINSPMTKDEVAQEARVIAEGIRSGRLRQKNFPARDDDQFMRRPLARLSDALAADTSLTDSQREALGKIGPETIRESIATRVRAALDRLGMKLRQGMVDRFAGLMEMDKQLLDGEVTTEENITRSSWVKARMASAAAGAVSALMNAGRIYLDKDGVIDVQKDTQGLIFSLHKLGSSAEIEKFMGWIAGNRAATLRDQGRENLFSDKDIEALRTLNEGKLPDGRDRGALYDEVFEEFQQYRDDVLTIADKAGLLKKAMEETDALIALAKDAGLGKGLVDKIKRLDKKISRAEDVETQEIASEAQGEAIAELTELLQQNLDDFEAQMDYLMTDQKELWMDEFYVPFYRVMEEDQGKAGGPRKTTGLSRQQAYKQLKGGTQNIRDLLQNTIMNFHHLLDASMKNMAAQQALDNAEQLGIAERTSASSAQDGASTYVLQDGRKQWYNIDDPFVYQSLMSLSHAGMNGAAMKLMRAFKRTFTNLTTSTPQFVIANLLRDSLSSIATTDLKMNPAGNLAQGFKNFGVLDRAGYERARLLASGGAFSFGHVYGEHADEIKYSVDSELKRARVISTKKGILGLLHSGWMHWQDVQNSAENANRMAAFKQAEEAGKGKLYAAFQARDLMDFSGMGAHPAIRFLIDTVPFLNARIQGLDKLYRSGVKPTAKVVWNMLGRGAATGDEKQAAARFMTVVGALSAATIALYLHNQDDDEFKKAPEWMRDSYWWIRSGDDVYLIPKPFEVGAIATLAERLVEQGMDDTATGDLFAERLGFMLMNTFSFSPVPQIMQPALDIYANRDSFTGRDIETMDMERLSPSNRFRSDTSSLAKGAGAVTEAILGADSGYALSPVQIDYLIAGYLGQVGAWGVASADVLVNTVTGHEQPASKWYEYQPMRRFYRDLDAPNPGKQQTLFYDALRESSRLYADLRQYKEVGDAAAAAEIREDNKELLAIRKRLNRAQRQLGSINRQIRQIERSDAMSGEEKRRRIDLLKMRKAQIIERVAPHIKKVRASS